MLMRTSRSWGSWLSLLALVAGSALLGGSAAAERVYTWQTQDGVAAYANDPRDIPRRYRAEARTIELDSLQSYPRYTPVDPKAGQDYANRVVNRLAYLRALNADLAAPRAAAPAGQGGVVVRADKSRSLTEVAVPTQGEPEGAPVVTETRRFKVKGWEVTRHNTIVRQGDRVIAVVKPRPHQDSAAFESEEGIED